MKKFIGLLLVCLLTVSCSVYDNSEHIVREAEQMSVYDKPMFKYDTGVRSFISSKKLFIGDTIIIRFEIKQKLKKKGGG